MFIALWPLALTGGDAGNGVKRVVGDSAIVSHPWSGAEVPDTRRHKSAPTDLYSAARSHRCVLGELLEVGTFLVGL